MRRKVTVLAFLFTLFICRDAGAEDRAVVTAISDGDTLRVIYQNKPERLRLIGIDAPESKANERAIRISRKSGQDLRTITGLGLRALDYTRQLAPEGTELRLEFDVERRDKFSRLLAYAHLPGGKMLNDEIIRSGYAYPMSVPPNLRYRQLFKEAFETARREKRGLWADSRQPEPQR